MSVKGKCVDHTGIRQAIMKFMKWLGKFQNVVLVAHNGRRYDFPVIVTALNNINQAVLFYNNAAAFIDTLTVFKKVWPNEKRLGDEIPQYKLRSTQYVGWCDVTWSSRDDQASIRSGDEAQLVSNSNSQRNDLEQGKVKEHGPLGPWLPLSAVLCVKDLWQKTLQGLVCSLAISK